MTVDVGGRPTVMTPEVIGKLEECFLIGATDLQACFVAGISKDALYDYQLLHPEFTERKEVLKSMTNFKAKKVLSEKIEEGDKQTAQWHLERKDPEYNPKSNINLGGQNGSNPVEAILKVEYVNASDT